MFTRRAIYHPYKRPAPLSPAGFRIADYFNPKRCFNLFQGPDVIDTSSPSPSPLNSPVREARHPQACTPPVVRLADFIAAKVLGTPQPPSNLADPDRPPNISTTSAKKTTGPGLPTPPRRKGMYKPNQFSFKHRPGLSPRRRAQQLKERRDAARRRVLDRFERRTVQAREAISSLRREAEALMTPERMDREDIIFLKQLRALQLDQVYEHDLEECRQQMSRAADDWEKRRREHKVRDREAAKMWGEGQDEEAEGEQRRKVDAFVRRKEERRQARYRRTEEAAILADEKQRRAHEAMERKIREEHERCFREELARKAKEEEERRIREERERRHQEERERMLREEVERLRREAQEQFLRRQRDRFMREERERLAREEREREARLLAEQARRAALEEQVRQHFGMYETKWNELRSSNSLPPIDVQQMPWPVFRVISSADQISYQEVRAFLFHPQRLGVEGKSDRDKVKSEVLRFHPDKFNTRIVPKIQASQRAVVQEIAGAVARILTTILTEEVEKQTSNA